MKTLKIGSKGDDVVALQHLLNVEGYKVKIDGEFGPRTETAVKMLQKASHLEEDGICGPRTWMALGVKNVTPTDSKCVDPSVVYAPLSHCITKTPNRAIRYIAIHYTAGGSSAPGSAKTMKAYWEKARRASADFGCDDRDIVQFNPDLRNYRCWSVGDKKNPYSGGGQLYRVATNANTISIEICSNLKPGYDRNAVNHDGWYFTEASLNNAVKLTKMLMKKFNVPIERIVRHYDISGKICPGIRHWNHASLYDASGKKTGQTNDESAWLEFKKRLK